MSAKDLRASLRHPLAARISPSEPAAVRIPVRHDLTASLDDRLRTAALP